MSTFYKSIARYYDRIFPVGQPQLELILDLAGQASSRVLDVACGTGSYSRELFLRGHEVVAIDNDPAMLELARDKTPGLDVRRVPMESIDCIEGGFDLIFCIGNSLVHLEDQTEIEGFIKDAYDLLHTDGSLLVQIVNYDRILSQKIGGLPTIDHNDLTFERHYHIEEDSIDFHTYLETEDGKVENHQPLYPILSEDLLDAFEKAGFIGIQMFENFYGDSFDINTSMFLIVLATK